MSLLGLGIETPSSLLLSPYQLALHAFAGRVVVFVAATSFLRSESFFNPPPPPFFCVCELFVKAVGENGVTCTRELLPLLLLLLPIPASTTSSFPLPSPPLCTPPNGRSFYHPPLHHSLPPPPLLSTASFLRATQPLSGTIIHPICPPAQPARLRAFLPSGCLPSSFTPSLLPSSTLAACLFFPFPTGPTCVSSSSSSSLLHPPFLLVSLLLCLAAACLCSTHTLSKHNRGGNLSFLF